jgi:hypothetical protein
MDILALRLLLTEKDVYDLGVPEALASQGVRDLRVQLTPQGIHLAGVYPTGFAEVNFTTLWQVFIHQGKVVARLADVQTSGGGDLAQALFGLLTPAAARQLLMTTLAKALSEEEAFQVEDDLLVLDSERLALKRGWTVRTNFTTVHCQQGYLLLEALAPPA